MLKIAIAGVCSVIMAINLRALKNEYGLYIAFAACVIIGGYGLAIASKMIDSINRISGYITSGQGYTIILIKIAGITYLSEFTSSICQDAGYSAIASQIEFASRLAILSMSIPVMTGLIEMISGV